MSGVGVIDIYDTIKNSNGEHCRICFRTASVRKLVDPVFLTQFQDAMKIGNNLKAAKSTDLKVCYMCEALAAKAVRFLWAVQLAAIIEKLCSHMEISTRRDVVLGHLNRTSQSPSSIYCLQAETIENSLYRLPHALTRTDTLIVGSDVASYSVQAAQVSTPEPTASDPAPLTHNTQDVQSTKDTQIDNIPDHPLKPIQTYPGKRIQMHTTHPQVIKPTPILEVAPAVSIPNKVSHSMGASIRNTLFNYGPTHSPKLIEKKPTHSPKLIEKKPTRTPKLIKKIPTHSPKLFENIRALSPKLIENTPTHTPKLIEMYQSKRIPQHTANDTYLPKAALRVLQSLGDVVVLADNFAASCRALALRTRTQDTKGKDEFALHFIVFFAGNTYVPFIKLKISTDGMVKSVTDQDLYTFVNPPPPENPLKKRSQSPVPTQTALHGNTTPNSNWEPTILQAMWNEDSVESKKQRVDYPVVLNPLVKEVILVVDEPTVNNFNINEEPSANNSSKSSDTDNMRMVTNKQPIPSTHRVDWEDKIPMDVISFMDATDPNPSERIMQPNPPIQSMGVISDVRTVIDSDVQIIESVECIDLC